MTDWDMLVETWPSSPALPQRTPQLSEVHAGTRNRPGRNGSRRRCEACSPRAAASPTRTTARRGARRRAICASRWRAACADRAYLRPGVVQRFDDHHPEVRAVPARACSRGSRSTDRSSTSAGSISPAKGRSRCSPATSTWAAGPNRPTRSRRRSISRRRRTSSSIATRFQVSGKGDFHGHVPPVQGRARAEGHVQQSARWA